MTIKIEDGIDDSWLNFRESFQLTFIDDFKN